MIFKLQQLTIENFKGIITAEIDIKGKDLIVSGPNGCGKSTLADSIFWLMTGANTETSKNFNIISLDENSVPKKNVDAMVMGVFKAGRKNLTLKKVYAQNWAKKRGSTKKELVGHITYHYFDDVPVSQTEYQNLIKEIIDPKIFRILADPLFFASKLALKNRREILMELAGAITDQELMEGDPFLIGLPDMLAKNKIDDLEKILKSRRKELSTQLDELPIRINELKATTPDVSTTPQQELVTKQNKLALQIADKQFEIASINSDPAKEKRILAIEKQILETQKLFDQETKQSYFAKKEASLNQEISLLEIDLKTFENSIATKKPMLKEIHNHIEKAYNDWKSIKSRPTPQDDHCPQCGQYLNPTLFKPVLDKFHQAQADDLNHINEIGSKLHDDFRELKAKTDQLESKVDRIKHDLDFKKNDLKDIAAQCKSTFDQAIKKRDEHLKVLKDEIEHIKTNQGKGERELKAKIQNDIEMLEIEKARIDHQILNITHLEKINRRIEELNNFVHDYAKELETVEKQLYMLETFRNKKAKYIENNINGYFKLTKWTLFEPQMNGGVKDICEPMLNGVPFNGGLNTGAKITLGLDIINTLAKHFDTWVPVIIDNCESLTSFQQFDIKQTIKLLASDKVESLTALIA